METNAVFIGRHVENLIGAGSLTVHSVFRKAVNISAGGGLLTVCRRSAGRAASYVVVMEDADFMGFVLPGTSVCVTGNVIGLGQLTVDISKALIWRGRMNGSMEGDAPFCNIAALKQALDCYAAPRSAWRLLHCDPGFRNAVDAFRSGLGAERLIGRGAGLTPSGDDFILGFMAVANHLGRYSDIRGNLRADVLKSLGATNVISAAMLRQAAGCEYHEFLDDLCHEILFGAPETVAVSAKRLIGVGATSGSDMLSGVYCALAV